jgi:glutaredoxin-like YruB-family protein
MTKVVKIYSTKRCGFCTAEKDWLKQNKIPFVEIDVENDQKSAKEMAEKSGQMGVPVTEIDGKIIVGFDKAAIAKELGIDKH